MTLLGLARFSCLLVLVASQDLDDGSTNETFQSQPEPSYDQPHYSEGPGGYSPPEGQKGVGVQHFDPSQVSTFGIFHNLPEIFNVLKDIRELMSIPQVQDLYQKMLNNQLSQWPREKPDGTPDRRPFIVIEGIKGSGKSATARLYTQRLNGTYLRSPPDYLANIRGMMSMKPRLVRSAYHALNNYLMAELVKSILKTRLVVMDQYWHGLTAFALAKLAGIRQNLPVPGSPIYNFPQDLLIPDISFFIAANDERRLFKLPDTGKPATSKVFRESTYEAYSLMDLPRMVPINGDRLREEVEAEMVKITYEQLQGFV